MKQIDEIIKAQPLNSLPNSLPVPKEQTVSIYSGHLSTRCMVESVAKIKKAFPNLPIDFYEILRDRLRANGFSDDRLRDAVNNVIDTCHYPTPTIADFIAFDRRFKILSYEEMTHKINEFGKEINNSYRMLKLPSRTKPVWVHVDDYTRYKLESYG